MGSWSNEELRRIAAADDLHVSPFRQDGVTYGTPTWIWSVVVGDELFARAYNGAKSRWYKAAIEQGAGRVTVAGVTKEVSFEAADDSMADRIDEAYRSKYKSSPYLQAMIAQRSRAAAVRILPRSY
jgi:hypothetical protein